MAQALGVSQPALYSHFRNLDALRGAVAMHGADELSRRVRTALEGLPPGDSRDAALLAMAHAYRDYVRQHPNRYLLQLSALRTEEYLTATEHAAEAVREVLRRYDLDDAQYGRRTPPSAPASTASPTSRRTRPSPSPGAPPTPTLTSSWACSPLASPICRSREPRTVEPVTVQAFEVAEVIARVEARGAAMEAVGCRTS